MSRDSSAAPSTAARHRQLYDLLRRRLLQNPEDVRAWFYLSRVVDSIEDQIIVLERVVQLDPAHRRARRRLTQLQLAHTDHVALGRAYEAGHAYDAAMRAYRFALRHPRYDADELIARKRLNKTRRQKRRWQRKNGRATPPVHLPPPPAANDALARGRFYEERGNLEQAGQAYHAAAMTASTIKTHKVAQVRLEAASAQRALPPIKLTAPTLTLSRLGGGPLLLYLMLVLLQGGLNPLRAPWSLWPGAALVLLGSLILTAANNTPHHRIWHTLLYPDDQRSRLNWVLLHALGLLCLILPFLFLVLIGLNRLAGAPPLIPSLLTP